MAIKVTCSWLIYSFLFFASGILCVRKLERRQAVLSCSVNTEEYFYCSNGLCIEWSWVCDGRKDCSDNSDETKELCAQYEYETNTTKNCGRVDSNRHQYIQTDDFKIVGTAPWTVQISEYTRNEGYILLCGGSIIAANVIISGAQCFWKYVMFSNKILVKNNKIIVSTIDFNDQQIADVEIIYIKEGYTGKHGLFADDISVIVLAEKFTFTKSVAPVCIDWNSIYEENNGDIGMVSIWNNTDGSQMGVLLERSVQYIDPGTCRNIEPDKFYQYVAIDKFCTNYTLETNIVAQDLGAGISFLHFNSYYLTGILSVNSYDYSKTNQSILGFTDIKYHFQWIRGVLNKHFTGHSCVLPTVEGVIYSYEGSNDILPHGTLISNKLTVIENCEVGYHKAYTYSFRYCLGNGKWLSNLDKLCFKMCPPLESDSLDIKCSHNCKFANCSNLSLPDTIAIASCKPTYTAPNGRDAAPLELHCQSNGTWNKQLYSCNPYCGRVYNIQNPVLIENGKKALVGTAPWNVGIYQLKQKNYNYDLICGGSIIAPTLVISAAHCFWQKGMLSNNISMNNGVYKIAVGKYDRNLTIIDNDFTQIINVEMIYLKEGYNGPTGFHAEDISIIKLQNRVSFSNDVAPVCIDWNGKYNEVNGDQGKIVSWGKTETEISSPILLESSLPYIDHTSCRNISYTNGFEAYIVTDDKFCAGSLGQGVGVGDSGAGLSFFHSDSYYLTGVASMNDPNANNSIAIFTAVKYHIQWIRGFHNKYN